MTIIMYTKNGCPWCEEAKKLLDEKGVVYEEKECRSNPANFEELVKKSGQSLTPTLDVDGEILADSDAVAISVFLKAKGVPGF